MLQDFSNNRMHCLIFGAHRNKLSNFGNLLRMNLSIPKVVILQLCRKSIYQGQVCVATAINVSDVIVDQTLPEIVEYKTKLPNSKKIYFFDGAMIPHQSLTSSIIELIDPRVEVYDLCDLDCCEDVMRLWTIGTITEVNVDRGWYYTYCSDCSVIGDCSSSEIVCPVCGENLLPNIHFKVHVTINDRGGHSAFLILMNELATSLIQTSIQSFISYYYKGRGKPLFPEEVFLSLIGKELLFKVKLEEHHVETTQRREYCVEKCCEHSKLLSFHKGKMFCAGLEGRPDPAHDKNVFQPGSSDDINEETSEDSGSSSDSDTSSV